MANISGGGRSRTGNTTTTTTGGGHSRTGNTTTTTASTVASTTPMLEEVVVPVTKDAVTKDSVLVNNMDIGNTSAPKVQELQTITNPVTPSNGAGTDGGGTTSATSIYQNYLNQILADQKAASDARQKALTDNYNRALSTLQATHNNEVNNLQNSADDALRQAYINYMLNQKGINQTLANQGITGGATESVLANLYNNYGSNRNAIETQRQNSLSDLAAQYDSSVANLASNYGNNLADVLADYYNSAANAKENYANKIASALASSGSSKSTSTNTGSGEYRPNGITDGAWNGIKSVMQRYLNGDIDGDYLTDYMGQYMNANDIRTVLGENGINANYVGTLNNTNNTGAGNNNGSITGATTTSAYSREKALNDLKYMRGQAGLTDEFYNAANNYINNLIATYGISEEEARELANAV